VTDHKPPPPASRVPTRASLLLTAALALLLGACSSTPVATPVSAPAPMAAPTAPAAPPAPTATTRPAAASTVATVSLPAHLDPKSTISTERSVYFDFDSSLVKPEYNGLVERQSKYLAANPNLAIKIEGNTDERGSAEYNLSLGQRRAEAVLRALKIYGVKDAQMEAISWGKEKPKATGHDESAWAENRRADLQYPNR